MCLTGLTSPWSDSFWSSLAGHSSHRAKVLEDKSRMRPAGHIACVLHFGAVELASSWYVLAGHGLQDAGAPDPKRRCFTCQRTIKGVAVSVLFTEAARGNIFACLRAPCQCPDPTGKMNLRHIFSVPMGRGLGSLRILASLSCCWASPDVSSVV